MYTQIRLNKFSQAQIREQLKIVNDDFGLKNIIYGHPNDEYLNRAVDTQISFCLPVFDPDGNETSGINYHQITPKTWNPTFEVTDPDNGGIAPWNPKDYINVWICNLDDTYAGLAQMPGGYENSDGIIINYKYFGNSNNQYYGEGRSLTHLIGNYLFLYNLWGTYECEDDRIQDTPVHGGTVYRCPEARIVSVCDITIPLMTMNFMSGTDDQCQYMFTYWQNRRMHAVLNIDGPRGDLQFTQTDCEKSLTNLIEEGKTNLTELDIIIVPNPTNGELTIKMLSKQIQIKKLLLYDLSGKKYFESEIDSNLDSYNLCRSSNQSGQ